MKKNSNKISMAIKKCSNDELDKILDELEIYDFTKEIEDETRSDKEEHLISFGMYNEKKLLDVIKKIKLK